MSYKPPADFHRSEASVSEEDQQNMFLIQVPKEFDINQLHGVKHVPGQIQDVAVDDSLPGQLSATYQLAASCMQTLNLKPLVKSEKQGATVIGQALEGHLLVTKSYSIESKPSQYTLPNFKKRGPSLVPMPAGLKVRFTPFGSGKPTPTPVRSSRHPKRHKRSREESSTFVSEDHEITENNVHIAATGDSHNETVNGYSVNSSDESALSGKHKKKKKDKRHNKNVSFSQLDSSFIMDRSGDAASKLSSSLILKTESSSYFTENCDSESPVQPKTKKLKLSSGYSSMDSSFDVTSSNLPSSSTAKDSSSKKKKKKHKRQRDE